MPVYGTPCLSSGMPMFEILLTTFPSSVYSTKNLVAFCVTLIATRVLPGRERDLVRDLRVHEVRADVRRTRASGGVARHDRRETLDQRERLRVRQEPVEQLTGAEVDHVEDDARLLSFE